MRGSSWGSRALVGALVALWAGVCGVAFAAETASGTFLDDVQPAGQTDPAPVVFRSGADQEWQTAAAGMDLQAGDQVWVKAGASAIVKIGGTAMMHLESDSVLTIPGDGVDSSGQVQRVHLDQGSAWTTVQTLLGGRRFEVTTKDAVGGVKGTQFHTGIDPVSGKTDWDMVEGTLQLQGRGAGEKAVALTDGNNFQFLKGGKAAFAAPRASGERLKRLKANFARRFGGELPSKAQVRQLLLKRGKRVARPFRRGAIRKGAGNGRAAAGERQLRRQQLREQLREQRRGRGRERRNERE